MNQNNSKLQKQWRILIPNIISSQTTPPLLIDDKYILSIGTYNDNYSIVNYDVQNEKYPRNLCLPAVAYTKLWAPALAFDSKNKLVYIWGGHCHACFMIYDLNKNEWILMLRKNSKRSIPEYNVKHVGFDSRAVCDGEQRLHVIGGHYSNAHMIFNKNRNKFEAIHI